MLSDKKEIEEFVVGTYGLKVSYHHHSDGCVTESVDVDEDGVQKEKALPNGKHVRYDLKHYDGVEYMLLYVPDGTIEHSKLLKHLQREEQLEVMTGREIKEWEELPQKVKNEKYVMYKLVPFTVQGVPVYYV